MNNLETKLKEYLNLYWLRPENALACTFKSNAFSHIKFESPSLDISCGDGMFMYIHLGGQFHVNFDYFKSIKENFSHSEFIDIYDEYTDDYEIHSIKKPDIQIDVGTDWKNSLLKKAEKLELYGKTIKHDNNTPLSFQENYFKTIYSNSIYWIDKVEIPLSSIQKILQKDGTAILEVMTPSLLNTLDKLESILSPNALKILDRNRRETMKGAKSYSEWKEIMMKCGFEIEEVKSVYPNKKIIDIWNIGLRPISHLLIQMSKSLTPETYIKVKQEWNEIFFELFKPLLTLSEQYVLEDSPYLLFKLKK